MWDCSSSFVITAFLAVVLSFATIAFADDYIETTGATNGILVWGDATGGQTRLAQKVTVATAGTVETAEACFKENTGAPTDDVVLGFYTDNAGEPDAPVASAQIDGTVGSTNQRHTFTFTPFAVTATDYWVVLSRSGSLDPSNFYSNCGDDASGTEFLYERSGSWNSYTGTGNIAFNVVTGSSTPPATTTASTINNPNQDMFNAIVVFFMSWFGVMWILRKRS